jgi:hypothetical protein
MKKSKQDMPSRREVFEFMTKESQPYRFEYVKESQPLRVNVEKKVIYVNEQVLLSVIKDLINAGLDWKEVMKKNLKHEKAHEKFFEWNLKWASSGNGAESYGWLASYLTDIVIDKIYYANDSQYQKWLIADSRHAFNITKRDLWKLFPNPHNRPAFLYNQAAYWVAIGAITFEEAIELYPEKASYIIELSKLFQKIKSEKDLEWAFPHAKALFFKHFGLHIQR